MSAHSSQDFELDELESDLKNLSDDLYLDDVGEWREDIESYSSESEQFFNRDQNSRTSQRQNRFRPKGRNISLKRGVNRFPFRGKGRPTGRRNFNDSAHRQFNNEKSMNFRESGRRRNLSLRRSDSYSKEDDPDCNIRRNQEYDIKRREGRFPTNRNSGNENESLQNTVADDTCKNTLFDRINTFSGSKCNEIPGLEFTEAYNDEKNKRQYGQENPGEKIKRQEHSPVPLRSNYSDRMSLSPSNSNKRHSLERTGSSASYYNSESRTSRWYRSEYDSRRHRSRSPSPRSPRSNDFSRDHSPQNQPYNNANDRHNGSSPDRYFRRSDISPRRSESTSPERNRMPASVPSPSANPACKKEWYPEVESSYMSQPSSDFQNPQQMPNIPSTYSGPGQYADTSAVITAYGPNYSNYANYNNPSYPSYDVRNTTTAYSHQPPAAPVQLVQPYMPHTNPQEYTRTGVCQQDVMWPAVSDNPATYRGQNQSQPLVAQVTASMVTPIPICLPQDTFQSISSNRPSGVSEKSIEEKKKEAIENELKQQRKSLARQREEYYSKSRTLRKELELLQDQKKELLAEKHPGNEKILKENQKLHTEIQNKLKAIANVTEMLSTIIGDDKDLIEELEDEKKKKATVETNKPQNKYSEKNSPTSDRDTKIIPSLLSVNTFEQNNKQHISESYKLEEQNIQESEQPSSVFGDKNKESVKTRYNYVHYDPEMHWCRVCDIFPKTAKEYLNHLHSEEHKGKTLEKNLVDMPWHKNQNVEETSHYEGAAVKRLPIRGLQFFISATAWYCKLCDVWIGDLHCASVHLKSALHSQKYSAFTEQNPHWEVDWLADRTRAYEKSSENRQKRIQNSDSLNRSPSFSIYNEKDSNENALEITKSLSDHLMAVLKEKNKKQSRSKQTRSKSSDSSSSDSSSSSSTSSDNTSDRKEEDAIDRAHSIRVTMRNKDISAVKVSKSDSYGRKKYSSPDKEVFRESRRSSTDDRMLHEWMEFSSIDKDRDMINNLKDRLKRKQATDREVVDRKKQYDKRRSSREEYRRYDERPMRDDYRKYDDRKKGYDDIRKRHTGKYDFDEKHGNKRNEKSPDRRSDKSKTEKVYSKTEGSKSDHKHFDSDEKNFTKSGTSKQNNKFIQEENDSDANESSLEKLTAESAAKKKDVKKNVQPFKCKLPFIGRMPFIGKIPAVKKKGEGDNVSKEKKQDSKPKLDESSSVEIENNAVLNIANSGTSLSKNRTELSAKTVNFPSLVGSTTGVITANIVSTVTAPSVITTNTTTVAITDSNTITSSVRSNTTKEHILPRSTLILSKTAGVAAKSAPSLKKKKMLDDGIAGGVEDMDIEVEDELSEENLPKDFQDALDILFPTETPSAENLSVENQSLTNINNSVPNNPAVINTISMGQNHNNMFQNAERNNNAGSSEPGQRNVLPMGHLAVHLHQYGINNVPPMGPMGGSGHVNNMNPSGHLKPSLLGPGPGPGPREQMILKNNIPCDRQMGPELEPASARQMNCRPDFNMIPNRMGQCLMGPGPDQGLNNLNHQQIGGPEMTMPQGGTGASVCPGVMGPGPPVGPVSLGPPGPHPELRPVGIGPQGILSPFGDEAGGIDADHSRGGFIYKRKNPPSQKKRQQMKKRRDMLEAREKELSEKIAELQGKMTTTEQNVKDGQSDTNNKKDDSKKMELALLGIDEDDICCK